MSLGTYIIFLITMFTSFVMSTNFWNQYHYNLPRISLPFSAVAVAQISSSRSSVRNVAHIMERLFLKSLRSNDSDDDEPPKKRFDGMWRSTFASDSGDDSAHNSTNITSNALPDDIQKYGNLRSILESKTFRVLTDKGQYLRQYFGGISADNINRIALKTAEQFDNPTYLMLRRYRLTASSFGAILEAIRRNSYPASLFKRILGDHLFEKKEPVRYRGKYNFGLLATRWGKFHERSAFEALKALHPSWDIKRAGLYLHESGLLGATPDAVTDDCVIEIKCPYRFRKEENLDPFLAPEMRYIVLRDANGSYYVNQYHIYYHQMQAEILFSGKQYGLLYIWTPNEAKLFKIEKEDSWAKNIDLILNFYEDKFIPYLLDVVQQNNET